MAYKDIRKEYLDRSHLFLEENIPVKEPFALFDEWYKAAAETPGIKEPNAVSIATATRDGKPSVRSILIKGHGKDGFKFFTNYTSRKGKELEENPNAAIIYYWPPLNRQIRIEGRVEKLSAKESDEYFKSRPYCSQIGAACSPQSEIIEGRQVLDEKEQELRGKYPEDKDKVPRPENWGGYLVKPHTIEFWQGQTDRLHDRIRFRRQKCSDQLGSGVCKGVEGWIYERLAP